jgi:3-ketosteroid 9alpha-monooxygenase subunit B
MGDLMPERTRAPVDGARSPRSEVLTVSRVIEETSDARSLIFDVPDELREQFAYKPGQFLTLRIPSLQTGWVARCYSLASSPQCDDDLKVTVKRTAAGYGSNWLCDNVIAGDRIEVLRPSGTFTPSHLDHDFLLWAAGSGVTPVISILKSALTVGSGHIALIYANRTELSVIFATELRELTRNHSHRLTVIHWLESVQGLPDVGQFAGLARRFGTRESFICGPAPFMDVVHSALAATGAPDGRVHTELFTSLTGDPFEGRVEDVEVAADDSDAADVEVELDGAVHSLRWPRARTLLDTMLSAGIDVPYSCREGQCGSCVATVVDGQVRMDKSDILEPEDIAEGLVLTCQARPGSAVARIQF